MKTVIKFDLVILKTFDLKIWSSEIRSTDPPQMWGSVDQISVDQMFLLSEINKLYFVKLETLLDDLT